MRRLLLSMEMHLCACFADAGSLTDGVSSRLEA